MITNKDIRVEGSNLILNGEKHPLDPAVEALTKRANIVQGKFSALDTRIDAIEAIEKTASGNPISLNGAAAAYAMGLSMTIEPIQSGSGDPSPTNVRPISGISEAVATRTGKNLFGNFELGKSISSETGENNDVNGGFRTAGKIRTAGYNAISLTLLDSVYKGSLTVLQYSDSAYIGVVEEIQTAQIQYPYNRTLTLNPATTYIRIKGWHGANVASINTAQFQVTLGSTPTTYEPYTAATASITLGQTVYGGSVNFKTGEVTVTHANISSYNGESINEPWLSSIDKYVSGATPTTGAQVVYPLTTPTTLTLTPAELELLKGNNTVSGNGANINISYIGR